jgi:hypothetical protein
VSAGSTSHRTFNFLTHGYNMSFFYWEVVVTVRKIVISAIIVFLNTINLRFQIYCIMLVRFPVDVLFVTN